MKFYSLLFLLLPFCVCAQGIVIKDVNLLDVENRKLIPKSSVYISDGKIQKIDRSGSFEGAPGDSLVDGKGKYLIPGLIDTHIHFFQSGGLYTRPDALDLTAITPYEAEIQFAKNNVRDYLDRYLSLGITTVVDVGGPFYNYTIRDSIAPREVGPNVWVTGPLFSMVDRPKLDKGDPPIIKITSKEEVLELFNRQLIHKPDFIKVWYVVSESSPAEKTYPLVQYLGELCREHKLKLAVHATQLRTAQLAVNAGANILVHSVDDALLDDEFIRSLKDNEVTYIPTLTVSEGYFKTFTGQIDHTEEDLSKANPTAYNTLTDLKKIDSIHWTPFLKKFYGIDYRPFLKKQDSIMSINLKRLIVEGINVATGTDAGNIGTMHASSYLQELLAMKKTGLSNWDILASSTLNAAKGFGRDQELGSIAIGKQADLVLLDKNPLDDLKALNAISMVIKSGTVLEAGAILEESPAQIVQRQVNAYNARDIDAFAATYAEDVKLYDKEGKMIMEGRDMLRSEYAPMFERVTNLYCEVVDRMVLNNTVADKEKVRFGERTVYAIAVYEVADGKIKTVRFVE